MWWWCIIQRRRWLGIFLPKPLNGSPFKKHRNAIMGVDEDAIEYYKVKYENEKAVYQNRIMS